MSLNHNSSSHYLQKTSTHTPSSPNHNLQQFTPSTWSHLYPNHHHQQPWSNHLIKPDLEDHHHLENQQLQSMNREMMEVLFEKPLTPSDVGKLNRLVIPKQHAEKYFPLAGVESSMSNISTGEKGLVLSFDDESGKCWRFRYSYWTSSQSYVLTKGWSRYVKDKQLDAGDVVFFQRHRSDPHRLFIGWRRRGGGGIAGDSGHPTLDDRVGGWSRGSSNNNNSNNSGQIEGDVSSNNTAPNHPFYSLYSNAGCSSGIVEREMPVAGNSKIVRLFGVNLECQLDPQSSPDAEDPPPHHRYLQNSQNYMDITFCGDVNQMRDRRG